MRKQVAVLISLSMLGALAIGARADAEEMRVRKNIDALTAEELSNYLHALDIVMRRDPTTVGSYAYYAALHNDVAVGPCEHASDTFLPWHRAHLFEFETELRLSDPPRTSNVTIPYWNWAELPSGSRFPLAFETEALIKRDDRNTTPICKGAPDPSCQRLPFPWADLDADVLSVSSWSSPAGNFGSFSQNQAVECADRMDGGFGKLEDPPHNTMHGYIGGAMGSPSTAAEDPIYWSFHAYIDLLWWNWQQRPSHTVDTCLNCKLCGLNWTVSQVVQSENQLKVSYDFTPPQPEPVAVAAQAVPGPIASVDFALSATETAADSHTSLVTIPSAPVDSAEAVIENVQISSPITYQLNAFFYPQSEASSFDPKDRAARERRLVYVSTIWERHHGRDPSRRVMQTFRVDLTPFLNPLVNEHAGETWVLDVRSYADPASSQEMHPMTSAAGSTANPLEFGGVGLSVQ